MGAILAVLVLAMILRGLAKLVTKQALSMWQHAMSYVLAGGLGLVLGAYGYADGGEPAWIVGINYLLFGLACAGALFIARQTFTITPKALPTKP